MNEILIPDPGQALRPQHKQTKLTRKNKLRVLEALGKEFNMSAAATSIGIHRQTLVKAMQTDMQFKDAVQEIKDAYLDTVQTSGFKVAIQPTREGYNDRKLILQAYREEFKPKGIEINTALQVNIDNAGQVIRQALDKAMIIDVDD